MCSSILYLLYKLSVAALLLFLTVFGLYEKLIVTFAPEPLQEYDYIIVGSGTAGSLIASRLEKETNYTYIVLEAGGSGLFLLNVPLLSPLLQGSPYDWAYQTESEPLACLAFKDQKCRWPRGKIIGGSLQLNNMIHVQGDIDQYVEWFSNKFSKDDIIEHFKGLEKTFFDISPIIFTSELADTVIQASKILNLGNFSKPALNQRNGWRWSPSNKINQRSIFTHSFVEKLIIKDKKAEGVDVKILSKNFKIKAKKGVILCAGAVESPKLLMLSGVGPDKHLQDFNIELVEDLPVGKNLMDHVATGMDLIVLNRTLSLNSNVVYNPLTYIDYFVRGKGALTFPGCEAIGFVSSENSTTDLQFMTLPAGLASDLGSNLKNVMGITENVWDKYYRKLLDKQTVSMLPIVLQPKSKGEVLLRSTNPLDPPKIKTNYLTDKDDIKVLIKGIRIIEKFIDTAAFQKLGASMNSEIFPGCEHLNFDSDDYWECYIRFMTLTSFHPVGTCSLNKVVDLNFKVKNVENLYVVDASVMPEEPFGNINAAIVLMASIFFDTNFKNKKISTSCYKYENILGYFLHFCFV